MPLIPPKDRSVKLTLHKDLVAASTSAFGGKLKKFGQDFTSQYLPTGGLAGAAVTSGLGKLGLKNPTLTLVGTMSTHMSYSAEVATEMGLFTSFMKPWFLKPVEIDISGESYLGTFPGISNNDTDIKSILEMFHQVANDFTNLHGPQGITDKAVLIEFNNNPDIAGGYMGFLKSFEFGEKVEDPYTLSYRIGFIGRPMAGSDVSNGRKYGQAAWSALGGR